MRYLFACTILLAARYVHSQAWHLPLPAPYTDIVTASRHADAFSFRNNSAALANLSSAAFGFFAEQRYLIPGLSNAAVGVGLPLNKQVAGLSLQYIGGGSAYQTMASAGVAQKLGKKGAIGVQVRHQSVRAAGYGAEKTLGFSVGALLRLTPEFQVLAGISNPQRAMDSKVQKPAQAARYALTFGCDLSEALLVTAGLEKLSGLPPSVDAGIQYMFSEKIFYRMAVGSSARLVMGGGYRLDMLRIDVFTALHSQLGFSPGLRLMLENKPRK